MKISNLTPVVGDLDGTERVPLNKAGTKSASTAQFSSLFTAEAQLAAQTALAASNYHPSVAAGEAATALDGLFSTDDGNGNLIYYRRTGGGSVEIARALTPASLATVVASTRFKGGFGPKPDYTKATFYSNKLCNDHADYSFLAQDTCDYSGALAAIIGSAAFNENSETIGDHDVDHRHGYQFYHHVNTTGGIMSVLAAFWSLADVVNGHVAEVSGLKVNNPSGAGIIDNLYGSIVGTLTRGSNNNICYYAGGASGAAGNNAAFYSAGVDVISHFGGKIKYGRGTTVYGEFGYSPALGHTVLQCRDDYDFKLTKGLGTPHIPFLRFGDPSTDATDAKIGQNAATGNLELHARPTYNTVVKNGALFVAEANQRVGVGFDNAVPDTQLHLKGSTDKTALTLENISGPNKWTMSAADPGVANAGLGFRDELAVSNKTRWYMDPAGNFRPGGDNLFNIGSILYRVKEYFASIGAINTSDARVKTAVRKLRKAEIKAGQQLRKEIGIYQFLASVEEKGDAARLHIGLTVQRAIEIMIDNGLDPFAYGFICQNAWDDVYRKEQVNVGEKLEVTNEYQRQKCIEVEHEQFEFEIVDGRAIRKTTVIKVEEPQFVEHLLFDEAGEPVMRLVNAAMPAVYEELDNGKRGKLLKEVTEAVYEQDIYREPVMETVTEIHEIDAEPVFEEVLEREAGDLYGFRYDQLYGFILGAI